MITFSESQQKIVDALEAVNNAHFPDNANILTVTEWADRCRECGARYGKLLKQKSGWISPDKLKKFKKEVENKYDDFANSWDERAEGRNEMICEILEMIDELMESEEV